MNQEASLSNGSLFVDLSPVQNQLALDGLGDWSPEEEWKRYKKRQEILRDVFTGERHPDEFLELIESHSIDVDDYLDEVDETLNSYLII